MTSAGPNHIRSLNDQHDGARLCERIFVTVKRAKASGIHHMDVGVMKFALFIREIDVRSSAEFRTIGDVYGKLQVASCMSLCHPLHSFPFTAFEKIINPPSESSEDGYNFKRGSSEDIWYRSQPLCNEFASSLGKCREALRLSALPVFVKYTSTPSPTKAFGAYATIKVNFKALDRYVIKTCRVYGTKEEIVRFFGAIDGTMLVHRHNVSKLETLNRSSFYTGLNKRLGMTLNRITFISHRLSEKDSDDEGEGGKLDIIKQDESDRMFTFEVAQTNEQEESVAVRKGFKAVSQAIARPEVHTDDPESTKPALVTPFLVHGEAAQGFMTVEHWAIGIVRGDRVLTICFLGTDRASDRLRLNEKLDDEALNILAHWGLEKRFTEQCREGRHHFSAIRSVSEARVKSKVAIHLGYLLTHIRDVLDTLIEGYLVIVGMPERSLRIIQLFKSLALLCEKKSLKLDKQARLQLLEALLEGEVESPKVTVKGSSGVSRWNNIDLTYNLATWARTAWKAVAGENDVNSMVDDLIRRATEGFLGQLEQDATRRAQLLGCERLLLVIANRAGNLSVYFKGIDGVIARSRGKSLNRENIGHDFLLAYDKSKKKMLAVVSSDKASGSAINLHPWYNDALFIRLACFVSGSEELVLVDSQARVFSLMTLQFGTGTIRPARLQLDNVPYDMSSTRDGACLLVTQAIANDLTVTAYHWNAFGSTEGIPLDMGSLTIENGHVVTSLINRSAVHMIVLDFEARVTEFMFKEKDALAFDNSEAQEANQAQDADVDLKASQVAMFQWLGTRETTSLRTRSKSNTTDPCRIFVALHNIAFYHLPLVSGIRDLRADKIGTLRSISGTVTRTSEVRPRLLYGSSVCGGLVNEIEQQFKYQGIVSTSV
ncbi:hypothetical protein L210DRAFT_3499679 [Boletus edulis BED1]|uniref:Uncharacterized protein n=1 Tax=Boletus edulis BED1 TaxID=1328754 RepID=A0AAD4C9K4_BOLED|nr:hypothetical protein L210DRAFT_3499679 [Boletus edulis BED1]